MILRQSHRNRSASHSPVADRVVRETKFDYRPSLFAVRELHDSSNHDSSSETAAGRVGSKDPIWGPAGGKE